MLYKKQLDFPYRHIQQYYTRTRRFSSDTVHYMAEDYCLHKLVRKPNIYAIAKKNKIPLVVIGQGEKSREQLASEICRKTMRDVE